MSELFGWNQMAFLESQALDPSRPEVRDLQKVQLLSKRLSVGESGVCSLLFSQEFTVLLAQYEYHEKSFEDILALFKKYINHIQLDADYLINSADRADVLWKYPAYQHILNAKLLERCLQDLLEKFTGSFFRRMSQVVNRSNMRIAVLMEYKYFEQIDQNILMRANLLTPTAVDGLELSD